MKTNKHFLSDISLQLHTFFYILLGAALLLRLILAAGSTGFETDIYCFGSWALRVYEGGFSNFYSPEVFTDYPPGYMYILYPIGALLSLFKLDILSPAGLVILKLPAIIADLLAGFIIFQVGSQYTTRQTSLLLSGLYLFNPAVLLNSVIWGQIDSILTLFIVLLCLFSMKGHTVKACFIFVFGMLLKPQMLVFAPILLYGLYEHEIIHFTSWKRFFLRVSGGFCSLLTLFLAMVPFGIEKVISQFLSTLGSYPYASVNAYNLWAFLGLNWVSQDETLAGISYKTIGFLVLVLLTIFSAVIFEVLRQKNKPERYVLTAAFLMLTTFIFSVRMHERYLYPAMFLLLLTALFNQNRSMLKSYLLISLSHFLNVWHVLYHYNPETYSEIMQTIEVFSGIALATAGYFYVCLFQNMAAPKSESPTPLFEDVLSDFHALYAPRKPVNSRKNSTITKIDWAVMAVITIVYAVVAFHNLGYSKAPLTEHQWKQNDTITMTFDKQNPPVDLGYYLKYEEGFSFTLSASADGVIWSEPEVIRIQNVFSWGGFSLPSDTSFLKLTNTDADSSLGELIFLNEKGEPVTPLNASDYILLFDEANTLPETFDFRSGSYFDEIYYTRTIYEFMEGLPSYENTHPPLGKIFILLGTVIFGMNPFGFRFMGTLFGVLMLPFLYLLAKNLIGNRFVSAMTTVCFAFDFMHFTQTRITTIDVYIVFFIIMMYFFMERYLRLSFYDSPLEKTLIPLGACGIAFGFGIACKWTGFYAGAGLAVLFFVSLYNRYREYKYACIAPLKSTNGISHEYIQLHFWSNTWRTIGFCIIFFIVVPAVIYVLSYIPFRDYAESNLLERMWNNQFTMYNYHSTLDATHPYSSTWYEWPTMVRPVFYYSNALGNDIYQGISAFGNPFVWYAAIPAALFTLYQAFVKHKPAAGFLSIGFLAMLLPWTLVARCTFLYHYFPCVPFLVLMIGYTALYLKKKMKPRYFYLLCAAYTLAVIVIFMMFYPVISGMPVSGSYVDTFLRWMDSWVLILN